MRRGGRSTTYGSYFIQKRSAAALRTCRAAAILRLIRGLGRSRRKADVRGAGPLTYQGFAIDSPGARACRVSRRGSWRRKKAARGRPLSNGSRSGDRDCRSGPALAKRGVAKPREAKQHHRPCGRLRHRGAEIAADIGCERAKRAGDDAGSRADVGEAQAGGPIKSGDEVRRDDVEVKLTLWVGDGLEADTVSAPPDPKTASENVPLRKLVLPLVMLNVPLSSAESISPPV